MKSTHEKIMDGQSALPTVPVMAKLSINLSKILSVFRKKCCANCKHYRYAPHWKGSYSCGHHWGYNAEGKCERNATFYIEALSIPNPLKDKCKHIAIKT